VPCQGVLCHLWDTHGTSGGQLGQEKTRSEAFALEVHRALQHLYDPVELGQSPLLALFGVADDRNPPAALQRILLEAIQALQPSAHVPAHARTWRTFHLLTYRYAEQLSQQETARDLAISVRQLRRQEKVAVRVLAEWLWNHYGLEHAADALASLSSPADTRGPAGDQDYCPAVSRESELQWLKESLPSETASSADILEGVLNTISPLAHSLGVEILYVPTSPGRAITGPLSTIRQALVGLLTAVVQMVPGGEVQVFAEPGPANLGVTIEASAGPGGFSPPDNELAETVSMARELATLFGGSISLQSGKDLLRTTLTLPALDQVAVLVIDDNADTLRLFERYLSGTRYAFVGTRDPDQALLLAQETTPRAVIVDVMLPGIDGWELLGRFREHPKTRGVPIIVCTILPQRRLALTLGAAGFLRKPVARDTLLRELDQQVASSAKDRADRPYGGHQLRNG
jgi:CheY-like chemotaxis protein